MSQSPLRPLSSLPRAERERLEAEILAAIEHILAPERKASLAARQLIAAGA